ncbi:MAG TPA: sialidase family protein [Ktedonobacteraceae bacterium]|nr:sialidase family protein [Ktedonobacteraceae bacterium]
MHMRPIMRQISLVVFPLLCTLIFSLILQTHAALAATTLLQVSNDPFTNTSSQHQTEVEPDTFSFGSTIVTAFQTGRISGGGSSDIGWATSNDNGATWSNGFLPGTTTFATPAGPFSAISDASVAFDAAHNTWLILSLGINSNETVLVSRSTDGGHTWSNPVTVASGSLDKTWIACDNTSTSPFFGHCYAEWDRTNSRNLLQMSTSTNGGSSWGTPRATAGNSHGLGGQPLVQPNGTVIVPYESTANSIRSFSSTNGGSSWNASVLISSANDHAVSGLRTEPLPTAEIDGSGKVYVVWQDCRFESGCSANDLVMSTSTNGTTWSAVTRIPIDSVGSGIDHVIPGLAVDPTTSGSSAHLALTFYFCASTCQLQVGFVSSTNGGANWSSETVLTSTPMPLTWIANTSQGRMVGDYISTSINNGLAFPVIAVASAPTGSTFHEAMFTVSGGLSLTGGALRASAGPILSSSASASPSSAQTTR